MLTSILRRMVSKLPASLTDRLRAARDSVRAIPYYGRGRWCPVCGVSARRFRTAGLVPREDAECPHCGAAERHRLVWLFLTRDTDLFDGLPKTMLHVAPERCFERRFRQALGGGYLTADLDTRRAMIKMDITNIDFPDHSFDVIYCSHVLEHVLEDRRAIREFRRILRPSGWAVLLVPVTAQQTVEDPTVVDPKERLRLYGQEDHVRRYGPDFVDRLQEAGFRVRVTTPSDLCAPTERIAMGLTDAAGEVYYCTR